MPAWRDREATSPGFASLSPELNTKRLEILKDAVPRLERVGLLRPSGQNISWDLQIKELMSAAKALKPKLAEIETPLDAKGFESAFKTAKQMQIGAMMTITTRPFFAERKRIVELAGQYRCQLFTFRRNSSMKADLWLME